MTLGVVLRKKPAALWIGLVVLRMMPSYLGRVPSLWRKVPVKMPVLRLSLKVKLGSAGTRLVLSAVVMPTVPVLVLVRRPSVHWRVVLPSPLMALRAPRALLPGAGRYWLALMPMPMPDGQPEG